MISTGRTWDVGNLHGCCGSLCFWGFFHRFTAYGISFRNNDDNGFFLFLCSDLPKASSTTGES